MRNTNIQAVIVAVILVVIIGGVWLLTHNAPAVTGSNTDQTTGQNQSSESVSVSDQPAGSEVRVASVTVDQTSWVAVRDTQRILGAARVDAGTHENISVPLLRNTETGTTYMVVVYADDGDRAFDFKKDTQIQNIGGSFSALNGD